MSVNIKGKWLEYQVEQDDVGKALEEILKVKLQISGRRIQKLTRTKGIFINNKKSFLDKKLKENDIIKVRIEEQMVSNIIPQSMELDIIYEDEYTLVINKEDGLSVYPTHSQEDNTLANGVQYYFNQTKHPSGIHFVHRLDTNTSGAIMIAKNSYAHHLLDLQLKDNVIKRNYIAIVEGILQTKKGRIDAPIARIDAQTTKRKVSVNGDKAITNYEVIGENNDYSMVMVSLETGRTHQIRVHFSHINHPIVGDKLYGSRRNESMDRQALHSYQLQWKDIQTEEIRVVTASIPIDMQEFIKTIDLKQKL